MLIRYQKLFEWTEIKIRCNCPNKNRWLSEHLSFNCKTCLIKTQQQSGINIMSALYPVPAVWPIGFQLRGGYLRAKIRMSPKNKKQPERKLCSVGVWHIYTLSSARSHFSVNMTTNFTVNAVESPEEQRAEIKGKILLCWHNSLTDRHSAPLEQQKPSVVAGNIPGWLQGTLLRNGPGIFSVGDTSYQHWFDGMAIMHSFTFRDGGSFFIFFF